MHSKALVTTSLGSIISLMLVMSLQCFSPKAQGQTICARSYEINGGTAYANFLESVKDCDIISGHITITGTFSQTSIDLQFGGGELRGDLIIDGTNLRSFYSEADLVILGENSSETRKALRSIGGSLKIRNNSNLVTVRMDELGLPPGHIEVVNNPNLASFDLTKETPPTPNDTPVELSGPWGFRDNGFDASGSKDGVAIGYPGLNLRLKGQLFITNEEMGVPLGGTAFDFSGLRYVEEIFIRNHGISSTHASLGEVTYGEDSFGNTVVSVSKGFQDLEEAISIDLRNNAFRDVSFPKLETLERLFIVEDDNDTLVDLNIPRLSQLNSFEVRGLGQSGSDKFGDRSGLGLQWGLANLRVVESQFKLEVASTSSADGLGSFNFRRWPLNIGTSVNGNPTEEPEITIAVATPEFSLSALGQINPTVSQLVLDGGSHNLSRTYESFFTDTDALTAITTVKNNLFIRALSLDDVSMLSNLREIGGTLLIEEVNSHRLAIHVNNSTLNGLETIEYIGGTLQLVDSRVGHCHALLPLLGWDTVARKVAGSDIRLGNQPSTCNYGVDSVAALKAEALGPMALSYSKPTRGGLEFRSISLPVASELFPVESYDVSCTANFRKSSVALGSTTFPANTLSTKSLSLSQAGKIEAIRVGVEFLAVDRSQVAMAIKAPSYSKALSLYNGGGSGTKSWTTEFTSTTSSNLAVLRNYGASGEWELRVDPGSSQAKFTRFYVDVDGKFSTQVDADAVTDDYLLLSVTDMPPGKTFQCAVAAVNSLGVRSESTPADALTPPTIPAGPVVTELVADGDGVSVYFDPPAYFGTEWFGEVSYTARCQRGEEGSLVSVSAPVSSSPAVIPGMSSEDELICSVSIDNLYEEVAGAVFTGVPDSLSSGLPIWLLYEASQPR